MAAKKQGKAKAAAAADHPDALAVGDRARVLAGDWGNARGEVVSLSGKTAVLKLEAEAHNDTVREFEVSNLAPARGHFDR